MQNRSTNSNIVVYFRNLSAQGSYRRGCRHEYYQLGSRMLGCDEHMETEQSSASAKEEDK